MIEYKVKVYHDGNKAWRWNDKLHCEHGPAIEYADGTNEWYLNGEQLTEGAFNKRMNKPCSGKVVEIEGVKYKLVEV
tara:strand:- start:3568 stop:3798 length:231 start_codon:yes stop_codon:yes gene_type:complete